MSSSIDLIQALPHPPIRACFFDVDGTILGTGQKLSPGFTEEISRVHQLGIRTGIASGRPYFAIRDFLQEVSFNAPCMVYSGSLIVDPTSHEPLIQHDLSPSVILAVLDALEGTDALVELFSATDYFAPAPHPLLDIHLTYLKVRPTFAELKAVANRERIIKMEVVVERGVGLVKCREALSRIEGLTTLFSSVADHPDIAFGNLTSSTATRENALHFLCNHLGVHRSEIATFGDAESDIPFLRLAGYGVAVDNAPPQVKEAARYITRHVDDGGVAYALQRLIPALGSL